MAIQTDPGAIFRRFRKNSTADSVLGVYGGETGNYRVIQIDKDVICSDRHNWWLDGLNGYLFTRNALEDLASIAGVRDVLSLLPDDYGIVLSALNAGRRKVDKSVTLTVKGSQITSVRVAKRTGWNEREAVEQALELTKGYNYTRLLVNKDGVSLGFVDRSSDVSGLAIGGEIFLSATQYTSRLRLHATKVDGGTLSIGEKCNFNLTLGQSADLSAVAKLKGCRTSLEAAIRSADVGKVDKELIRQHCRKEYIQKVYDQLSDRLTGNRLADVKILMDAELSGDVTPERQILLEAVSGMVLLDGKFWVA